MLRRIKQRDIYPWMTVNPCVRVPVLKNLYAGFDIFEAETSTSSIPSVWEADPVLTRMKQRGISRMAIRKPQLEVLIYTRRNASKCIEMRRNALKCVEMRPNTSKCVEMCHISAGCSAQEVSPDGSLSRPTSQDTACIQSTRCVNICSVISSVTTTMTVPTP